ncbi:MAG TPA: magnesium/cobalt transporter CorA [Polyangiales bacterium]
MLRSLGLTGQKIPVRGDSAQEAMPPSAGGLIWIDLTAPAEADMTLLGERFGFHPLALEDCLHQDQRPKAEEYGDHLFVVTQSFQCPDGKLEELRWHELHAFLGESYLITVHDAPIPGLEHVWKRLDGDPALLGRGVDFMYYLVVDALVDGNAPVLDLIAEALEVIEDDVLTHPTPAALSRIFSLKQQLVMMRKVLSPQRDVMAMLSRRGDARISERTSVYFRDVYDHLARTVEAIEANRDLLGNALDAYLSATGQRTNEIMKALAILSAIFMPLTFITGFFGQNFETLPFKSEALMWGMLGSLVVTPALLFWWFKKRQWL